MGKATKKPPVIDAADLGVDIFNKSAPIPFQLNPSLGGDIKLGEGIDISKIPQNANAQMAIDDQRDQQQAWYNKLGNGTAKALGSFGAGTNSFVGALSAIPTTLTRFAHGDFTLQDFWDNPFTKLAESATEWSGGFKNYQSADEQMNMNPYSPTNWATWNFFSDNILGNAGYIASSYMTGVGMARLIQKAAPFVIGGKLKEATDLALQSGRPLEQILDESYKALKIFDRATKGTAATLQAFGEGSLEASNAGQEYMTQAIEKYKQDHPGEMTVPDNVMEEFKKNANHVSATTFGLNLPILVASDLMQFGKQMSGFKNEAKNIYKIEQMAGVGSKYASQEMEKGMFHNYIKNGIVSFAKNGFTESAEEGLQFIASEGSKNFWMRKYDNSAQRTIGDLMDSYLSASKDLFTTKEGFANLAAGFGGNVVARIPGSGYRAVQAKIENTKSAIEELNGISISDALKPKLESLIVDASIQRDMNKALKGNDRFQYENLKADRLKTWVLSRIRSGNADMIDTELDQLKGLPLDEFNGLFGLTENTKSPAELIEAVKIDAKRQQNLWDHVERVFNPQLLNLNEKDKNKTQQVESAKINLWSYLADHANSEKRVGELTKELTALTGSAYGVAGMVANETDNKKFNNYVKKYKEAKIRLQLHIDNESSPAEIKKLKAKERRLRKIVTDYARDNKKDIKMSDFYRNQDPNYLEAYIDDVVKAVNSTANVIGADNLNKLTDVNDIDNKLTDLYYLDRRRQIAIDSYNRLAKAFKNNTFENEFIENPDYKEEVHKNMETTDENYQPKYLDRQKFLNTDYYKELEAERQAEKESDLENQTEIEEFSKELQVKTSETDKSFKSQVKAEMKKMKQLSNDDFRTLIEQNNNSIIERLSTGKFDIADKESRDKFDMAGYLKERALDTAIENERDNRNKKRDKRIEEMANLVVSGSLDINSITNPVLKTAIEEKVIEINQKRTARAAAATPAAQTASQTNPVSTSSKAADLKLTAEEVMFIKEIKETPADTLVGDLLTERFKKLIAFTNAHAGDPLFKKEGIMSNFNQIQMSMSSLFQGKLSPEDFIVNAKIFEEALISEYVLAEPVITVKPIIVAESIEPLNQVSNTEMQQTTAETASALNQGLQPVTTFYFPVRKKDIETVEVNGKTENMYDKDGNVIINQEGNYNPQLFNPKSDVFIETNDNVQYVFIDTDPDTKEKRIGIFSKDTFLGYLPALKVKGNDGKIVDNDFKLIRATFDNEKAFQDFITDYKKAIVDIKSKITKNNVITASVTQITFGNLIQNELSNQRGADGQLVRQARNMEKSFTVDSLNNPDHTAPVHIGIYQNGKVKSYDNAGNEINLEDVGVELPDSLLKSLQKNRTKQEIDNLNGQTIALIPTNTMGNNARVYMPIILRTNLTGSIVAEDGSVPPRTIGEALIEDLLTPYTEDGRIKPIIKEFIYQNEPSLKGKEIPIESVKNLYTTERIRKIINSLFYTDFADNRDEKGNRITFKIEISKSKNGQGIAFDIQIGLDGAVDRQRATAYIFNDDGTPNLESVVDKLKDKSPNKTVVWKNAKNGEKAIVDVINSKPVRIDKARIGAKVSDYTTGYKGISITKDGSLEYKVFPSYHHWLDSVNALTATIQGIEKDGVRSYFVNPIVKTVPLSNIKPTTEPAITETTNEIFVAPVTDETVKGMTDEEAKAEVKKKKEQLTKIDEEDIDFMSLPDLAENITTPTQFQNKLIKSPVVEAKLSEYTYKKLIDIIFENELQSKSFNLDQLKRLLDKELKEIITRKYGEVGTIDVTNKDEILNHISMLEHIADFLDYGDYKNEKKYTDSGKFIGYFNVAYSKLLQNGILKGGYNIFETLEYDAFEDRMETHYQENWYMKSDPKKTIAKLAKKALSKIVIVEKVEVNGEIEYVPKLDIFGEQSYYDFNTIYETMINLFSQSTGNTIMADFNEMASAKNPLGSTMAYSINQELNRIAEKFNKDKANQVKQTIVNSLLKMKQQSRTTKLDRDTKSDKRGGSTKMMRTDRQNIESKIIDKWNENFINSPLKSLIKSQIKQLKIKNADGSVTLINKEVYSFDTKKALAEYKDKLKNAITSANSALALTDQNCKDIAAVLHDFGIDLSSNPALSWRVIKELDRPMGNNRKFYKYAASKEFSGKSGFRNFLNTRLIKDFVEALESRIIKSNNPDSNFTLENPFDTTLSSLQTFARIASVNYQDEFSTSSQTNINGDQTFTLVPSMYINEQFNRLFRSDKTVITPNGKEVIESKYLNNFVDTIDAEGIPFSRHNLLIQELARNPEARKAISLEFMDGVEIDKYYKLSGSNATKGTWDLMSMLQFQNDERIAENANRKHGFYTTTHADKTVVPMYLFNKFMIAADYDGQTFKLKDGEVKNTMYSIFKSEVDRVAATYLIFNRIEEAATDLADAVTAEEIKIAQDNLNNLILNASEGVHYVKNADGSYSVGSGSRIYLWGNKVFQPEISGIYELDNDGDVIGLQEELFVNDSINDVFLRNRFESFIDEHVDDLLDEIVTRLEPFKEQIIADGKFKMFSGNYLDSLEIIMDRNISSTSDDLMVTYNGDAVTRDTDEYNDLLYKYALLDYTINSVIFNGTWNQLHDDIAYFEKGGDYFETQKNAIQKRFNKNVTPSNKMATDETQRLRTLTTKKVKAGELKINVKPATVEKLNKEFFDYLSTFKVNGKLVIEKLPNGHYDIPVHFKDYQAIYELLKSEPKRAKKVIQQYLEQVTDDGGAQMTLREFVYRAVQENKMSVKQGEKYYEKWKEYNPELTIEDYIRDTPFKVGKYVVAGTNITGEGVFKRQETIYNKYAISVLVPILTHGTVNDKIRTELELIESRDDNTDTIRRGIILNPESGDKGKANFTFNLYDKYGNLATDADGIPNIQSATFQYTNPENSGLQIESVTSLENEAILSKQAANFMHIGVSIQARFGEDLFMLEPDVRKASQLLGSINAALNDDVDNDVDINPVRNGITSREMLNAKNAITNSMMAKELNNLFLKWGVKVSEVEYGDEAEEDKKNEKKSNTYIDIIVDDVSKLLDAIKSQVLDNNGLDINKLQRLDLIEKDGRKGIRLPLTYSPDNLQYQNILLSSISKIVTRLKLPGFTGHQTSAMGKNSIKTKEYLHGFRKVTNADGTEKWLNPQIEIPWTFKHPVTGKLLDFDMYVNADGTPKLEMFDEEMLNIIGIRIPGTGPNTVSPFTITKFYHPNAGDTIAVPFTTLTQMNADLDYDSLPMYIYNFSIDSNGRLNKIKGIIKNGQVGQDEVLDSHRNRLATYARLMYARNSEFRDKWDLLTREIKNKINYSEFQDEDVFDLTAEDLMGDELSFRGLMIELMDILNPKTKKAWGNFVGKAIELEDAEANSDEVATKTDALIRMKNELTDQVIQYMEDDSVSWDKVSVYDKQSKKQLQNAFIDTFHIMMANDELKKSMITPLTTDYVNERLEAPISYIDKNGVEQTTNIYEVNSRAKFTSITSPTTLNTIRTTNSSAGKVIGIAASSLHLTTWLNTFGIKMQYDNSENDKGQKIGWNRGIEFAQLDADGNPMEDENGKTIIKTDEKYPALDNRTYSKSLDRGERGFGKPISGRYNFTRIYDIIDGERVTVLNAAQSTLQSALDNAGDPRLGYANINEITFNVNDYMSKLGLFEEAANLLVQPIIYDYVRLVELSKSPLSKSYQGNAQKLRDTLPELIKNYALNAGFQQDVIDLVYDEYVESLTPYNNEEDEVSPKYNQTILYLLDNLLSYDRNSRNQRLSVADLKKGFVDGAGLTMVKSSNYDINQLKALYEYLVADYFAKQHVAIQIDLLNPASKGYGKDGTIEGARVMAKKANNILGSYTYVDANNEKNQAVNVYGVHRLVSRKQVENEDGSKSFVRNPGYIPNAFSNAITVLTHKGLRTINESGLFDESSKMYPTIQNMLKFYMSDNDKLDESGTNKRINLSLQSYIYSNPDIYRNLFETEADFREFKKLNRELLWQEKYGSTTKEDGTIEYDLTDVKRKSIAAQLDQLAKDTDSKGISFKDKFDILASLRGYVKDNNETISRVVKTNATNYKDNADMLLSASIQRILELPITTTSTNPAIIAGVTKNKELKKLMNMLIISAYMSGGIRNQVSFIQDIPEYYKTQSQIKQNIAATVNMMKDELDKYVFSPNFYENQKAYPLTFSFIRQYFQHNPFEIKANVSDTDIYAVRKVPGAKEMFVIMNKSTQKPLNNGQLIAYRQLKAGLEIFINVSKNEKTTLWQRVDSLGLSKQYLSEYSFGDRIAESINMFNKQNYLENKQLRIEKLAREAMEEQKQFAEAERLRLEMEAGESGEIKVQTLQAGMGVISDKLADQLSWIESTVEPNKKNFTAPFLRKLEFVNFIRNRYPDAVNAIRFNRDDKSEDKLGFYTNGVVSINEGNILKHYKNPFNGFTSVLTHELGHGMTSNIINDMNKLSDEAIAEIYTSAQIKAYRDFSLFYQTLVTEHGPKIRKALEGVKDKISAVEIDKAIGLDYRDMKEFVAAFMGNKEFQEILNNIPVTKNKSFFQRLMDEIVKLLGFKKGSVAEQAFYEIVNLMDAQNVNSDYHLMGLTEKDFMSVPIKPGVEELFESNPELANSVYEALGLKTNKKGLLELVHYSSRNTNPLDNFQEDFTLYTSKGETSEYKDYGKQFNFLVKNNANIKSLNDFHGKYGIDLDKHDQNSKGLQPYHFSLQEIQAIRKEGVDILIDDWGEYIILNKNSVVLKKQQKQQAQQLYSQYLDSLNKPNTNPILQGNQTNVEEIITQLEKEGLLEIDCKGLKAEKGLVTSFTKGGKWKLIKDLKDYPTHKEGGVDLTIGKDGVKIKNGNSEFTAKHGLVIPKN